MKELKQNINSAFPWAVGLREQFYILYFYKFFKISKENVLLQESGKKRMFF